MKATVVDMSSNKPRCVGYVWLILYLFRNADQNSIQLALLGAEFSSVLLIYGR